MTTGLADCLHDHLCGCHNPDCVAIWEFKVGKAAAAAMKADKRCRALETQGGPWALQYSMWLATYYNENFDALHAAVGRGVRSAAAGEAVLRQMLALRNQMPWVLQCRPPHSLPDKDPVLYTSHSYRACPQWVGDEMVLTILTNLHTQTRRQWQRSRKKRRLPAPHHTASGMDRSCLTIDDAFWSRIVSVVRSIPHHTLHTHYTHYYTHYTQYIHTTPHTTLHNPNNPNNPDLHELNELNELNGQ
jgi:hypothetical protein